MTGRRASNRRAGRAVLPPRLRDHQIERNAERLEGLFIRAREEGDARLEHLLRYALGQLCTAGNPGPVGTLLAFRRIPVSIDEFVESPEYLGHDFDVWPTLMPDLRALNPDVLAGEAPVHEAFLGGATGIGKSMVGRITVLYQVYLLTCLREPQAYYGLEPNTPLVFPLQSVTPDVTQRVLYEPLRKMFEAMPFAQKNLTWNRRRTRALEIEGDIHVVPLLANIETVLGQAIPGALLDEVNFMRIVERSKRVAGPRGLGGRYDQADEIYREISQRRRSRFVNQGVSIGCIVVSSSTRYQNDFLDRRAREVEEYERQNVVVTRHKRYDIVPQDRYSGETFRLLVGTDRYRTRILDDDDVTPEGGRVEQVPVEHLEEFRRDPEFSLRAIVGVAVDSLGPFIDRPEKIAEATEQGDDLGLRQWVDKPDVALQYEALPRWLSEAIPNDKDAMRFVHLDLSHTRDACGVAVVKYLGTVDVVSPDAPGAIERKPRFAVEAAISIRPSPDAELILSDLRRWILELVDVQGLDICAITTDGYQSTDTLQILTRRGIRTKVISVDSSPAPYEYLRECLYEGRLALVDSATLRRELHRLERNPETGRIDHPPRGSKDVADAVCGALTSAVHARQLRGEVGFFDAEGRPLRSRRAVRRPQGRIRPRV